MGSVMLLLVVLARVAEVVVTTPASCRLSEFLCNTGRCVATDNFCDGEDDCGDKSDEPPYCTPCNRTYYGDVGRTYEVEIRRPREDRLPFLCHLNFTAGGGDLGDLIQLTFDTFTVGQFVSFTSEGCPDGYMTITELGLPSTGGQWCGSAWGYTVYYSETSSLNLTLHLYRLSEQGIGYNFDFKLAYKVLRRSEARLRYDNATWRGDLVPGTYCDRVLDGCDSRPCRIQSPNFPGVYPRNVTCYYRLEHHHVPKGKYALLAVRQRNSHKMHIKDQVVKYDRSQRVLRLWDQCNVVQDYLTVYDGNSTADPILVRLCGGDVVPDIVSSGPSMLLVFHTSPYDNPFHPVPLSYLPGFELEVQVLTVDSSSYRYIPRTNRQCEFLLTSFDSLRGQLETPRHSLPPNSVCRYHFQGRRNRETVWISFVKYQVSVYDHLPQTDQCDTRLRLWDGRHDPTDQQVTNASLLGEFCKDEVPKLCDHSLLSNSSRFTRPCSLSESYVSTGPDLTLELSLRHSSALYPVSFLLRYEFVDTMLGGAPFDSTSSESGSCDRIYTSDSGTFQSPRSVFLFGRGGAADLSCVSRFQTHKRDYTVRLTFTRAQFGERMCQSLQDPRTGRWRCRMFSGNRNSVAELWISEYPWPGVRMPRDCFCSKFTEPLVVTGLTSSLVEVNFTVTNMNITQDFNDFYFEGEYEFVPKPDADSLCSATRDERRLRGSSGEIELGMSVLQDVHDERSVQRNVCVNYPWLIEPVDPLNNFLYLKIRGVELTDVRQHCDVLNRIIVYTGTSLREPRVVCPSEQEYHMVEVFSEGWNRSSSGLLEVHHARSFVLEFLDREPGSFFVTWMEVSKRPLLSSSYVSNPPLDCPYRCPELNACISVALWCDGSRHCPSGYDEDDVNCVALYQRVPLLYIGIGAGALSLLSLLIAVSAAGIKCRQQQRKRRRKVQVSNGDAKRCYAANPHHDMFLDKDSLC